MKTDLSATPGRNGLLRMPDFPVFIPSKSRADTATTPRHLDEIGVPYRIIVEEFYASHT